MSRSHCDVAAQLRLKALAEALPRWMSGWVLDRDGTEVLKQNHKKSFEWAVKAANQGSDQAMVSPPPHPESDSLNTHPVHTAPVAPAPY